MPPGDTSGRSSRRYRHLAREVRRIAQGTNAPCVLCKQPIDYTLEHPDPGSFSVEHLQPWSTHPHLREDPSNLAPAHLSCNSSRGRRSAPATIGQTSRTW